MTASAPWPALKRDLVAILRGIRPDETATIVAELLDAGFEAVEIPLNSPDPFRSIEIAAGVAPKGTLIGAGTVLDTESVDRLASAGGTLMVSPNVDAMVLARAGGHGMVTLPGVFTPTEAFAALRAGASGLKFFPASVLGSSGVAAIRAVLPLQTVIAAVGGVADKDFAAWGMVGVRAFGLGSSLYKPGMTAEDVGRNARAAVAAWDAVFAGE